MSYLPPVKCELNEMEFDWEDSMDPYDSLGPIESSSPVLRVREKKTGHSLLRRLQGSETGRSRSRYWRPR